MVSVIVDAVIIITYCFLLQISGGVGGQVLF